MEYMLPDTISEIANEWNKYKNYTVRPVQSTEEYYKKYIARYKQGDRFLMYGGTPEIRTIFQQQDKNVTMVDRSEKIVHAMGLLTDHKMPIGLNEKFVQTDWLDMISISTKFDLIIGDDAINMLKWADFELFLQQASRLLDDNGVFICHLLVKPDDLHIKKTTADLLGELNQGAISTKFDLASKLNFICYDHLSYGMGWQSTINQIGSKDLALFKPYLDFIETFGMCNSQFSCPPQDQFELLVKQYFLIEEVFYPHEYDYCLYEPVYILRKINR